MQDYEDLTVQKPLLPLFRKPIQKDGDQAWDGLSSAHRTRTQRPPDPGTPRGDTASGPCCTVVGIGLSNVLNPPQEHVGTTSLVLL